MPRQRLHIQQIPLPVSLTLHDPNDPSSSTSKAPATRIVQQSPRACLPYLWSFALQSDSVTTRDSRFRTFSDAEWERIEPLLPSNLGQRGHPFGDNRWVVEGIIYRYRTGIPWRDLPREEYGPWQTVWKRHRRYAGDGTWDQVLAQILAEADAAGKIDWTVSVDATITRAHQHATNTTRPEQDTGGSVELQESAARAG